MPRKARPWRWQQRIPPGTAVPGSLWPHIPIPQAGAPELRAGITQPIPCHSTFQYMMHLAEVFSNCLIKNTFNKNTIEV